MTAVPILRITDVHTATDFYTSFLGFSTDWKHHPTEGGPIYMQVSREGLVLHLSENDRFREGTALYIDTSDLDALHQELSGTSGPWDPPAVLSTPWQTRQMELQDPFGNLLRFNEQMA
ncbi:MAG: VOC family protein [Bacteroidetes bacterium]|nr:VOC family protein [Bacteroidota bacterium]